ncbi:hypothetical protein [Paenibacillus odorifer]|nr:hypothetical protein [Paenibacillus odorifer]
MAPRAIAVLRDRGSGARARAVRPAAQGRGMAPRAIAALRDRGSGARKEAAAAAQDCPKIEKSFID